MSSNAKSARHGGIMREIKQAASALLCILLHLQGLLPSQIKKRMLTAITETKDSSVPAISLELNFRLCVNSSQATKCRCSLLELWEEATGKIAVCHIPTPRNPPSAFRRAKQHLSWNKSVSWGYKYIPSWTQILNSKWLIREEDTHAG